MVKSLIFFYCIRFFCTPCCGPSFAETCYRNIQFGNVTLFRTQLPSAVAVFNTDPARTLRMERGKRRFKAHPLDVICGLWVLENQQLGSNKCWLIQGCFRHSTFHVSRIVIMYHWFIHQWLSLSLTLTSTNYHWLSLIIICLLLKWYFAMKPIRCDESWTLHVAVARASLSWPRSSCRGCGSLKHRNWESRNPTSLRKVSPA